ncbi:hypothetical protein EVG20_g3774 [Dentipellis fragilis]|uniref:Csf1 N-terminal domain-containing protein n=1 Tax=Dentipellis fragilis TaxID=205917 RepID=A0A4Y9Z1M5_9AGAM|nr:hypothetical protein EVG20_g3774 [Dentipellis fragilis]
MLDWLFLIVTIVVVIALLLYLFFWNRVIGFLLSLALKVAYWNQGGASIWVDIGSIHFSLLAGRVIFKDLCYHSSNQTIKIVKGQVSWRYWIRAPTLEDDIHRVHASGEGASDNRSLRPSLCRIHASVDGFEWFLYNRTSAFDNIVSAMEEDNTETGRGARSYSTDGTSFRNVFSKSFATADSEPLYPPFTRAPALPLKASRYIRRTMEWFTSQLPNLDLKSLLPVSFEGIKGAILCGNASASNTLVAEFSRASGVFGTVPARSKYDLYKQTLDIKFESATVSLIDNALYQDSMSATGARLRDQIANSHSLILRGFHFLSFPSFLKLWKAVKLDSIVRGGPQAATSKGMFTSNQSSSFRGRRRAAKSLDGETPVGIDFSKLEYAVERKVLEAPMLELTYYADAVGLVPLDQQMLEYEGYDVGNGDLSPEWGVDLVIHGGFVKYGPWADRQRVELQHAFFPPSYRDSKPTAPLKPGEKRVWTTMRIFVELRGGTTVYMPFREASKNWQWDGQVDVPRPKKREPASINIKAGDDSTISYVMPVVASAAGYEPLLEIHLDTVAVTTSLNDIRLLTTESCRIHCNPFTPLRWNESRTWTIELSLRRPVLYLLRDHINMLADLGKDWASGGSSNYFTWVPTQYAVNVNMRNYEINTYVNDHNIIDKPLIREENALLTFRGAVLRNENFIPSERYMPASTTIPFVVDAPDIHVSLTLPRWNTHSLHAIEPTTHIGRIGLLRVEGSYLYFAEIREENIEQLRLTFSTNDVLFKCVGWAIRHFMIFRENYFGYFTQFSTLDEYLKKRRSGVPIGDPIDQKYRPGKSNQLQVELQVSLDRSLVFLPTGIPGYETHNPSPNQPTEDVDLGTCAVLTIPNLQLNLRSHDYFMEMNLNIGTLFGDIRRHCSERSMFESPSWVPDRELVVIDGIDIVANRLFGPQPRTSTYICVWEINVGAIKAILSGLEGRAFMAASDAFIVNYRDILNSPAEEFTLSPDPDATFLKVSFSEADVVWQSSKAAVQVCVPQGLGLESNNLAGNHYRQLVTLRLPQILTRLLYRQTARNRWLETGRIEFDGAMDLYSSPMGWKESSIKQAAFIAEQDTLSGRVQNLFSSRTKPKNRISGNHLWIAGLQLPRLSEPSARKMRTSRKDEQNYVEVTKPTPYPFRFPSLDSDDEDPYTDSDRDFRLANSRPASSLPVIYAEDENLSSGDESDNADLTDESIAESEKSEFAQGRSVMADSYARLIKHFTFQTCQPSLWNGPAFLLSRDSQTFDPVHSHYEESDFAKSNGSSSPDWHAEMTGTHSCQTTSLRLSSRSIEIHITPLVFEVITGLAEECPLSAMSSELRLDALLADHLKAFSRVQKSKQNLVMDLGVSRVHISTLQIDSMAKNTAFEPPFSSPSAVPKTNEGVSSAHIDCQQLHIQGQFIDGEKQRLSFSSSFHGLRIMLQVRGSDYSVATLYPVFHVALSDFTISLAAKSLSMVWGPFTLSSHHSGPYHLLGALNCHLESAGKAMEVQKRLDVISTRRSQHHIREILKWSEEHSVVYPLSAIQPSYLVQTGKPHDLRIDTTFRILFYLRDCLRFLEADEHEALREAQLEGTLVVSAEEIVDLLQRQTTSLATEADLVSLSDLGILSKMFPTTEMGQASQNAHFTFLSLEGGVVEFASIVVQVWDDEHTSSSILCFKNAKMTACFRQSELQPSAASKATLPRDRTRQKLRHLLLSVLLNEVDVCVVSHIFKFAQTLLHIQDHLDRYSSWKVFEQRSSNSINQPLSLTDLPHLEISLSLQHFRVQAAAEKLIVVWRIGHIIFVTSALIRSQTFSYRHSDLSINTLMQFNSISLEAHSRPGKISPTAEDILASVVLRRGGVHAVLRQEPILSSTIRGAVSADEFLLSVPRSAIRLWRFIDEWRAEYTPGINATVEALSSEPKLKLASNSSSLSPLPILQKKHPAMHIQASLKSLRIRLHVMTGTWLFWELCDIVGYLRFSMTSSRKSSRSFGLRIGSQQTSISSTHGDSQPSFADRLKLDLPSITLTGQYQNKGVDILVRVGLFQVTVKPSYWDTLLSVQQKFGQDFNDLLIFIDAQRKRSSSVHPTAQQASGSLIHNGMLKINGFRVGLEGRSSIVYLECQDINGGFSADATGLWYMNVTGLALSLAPRTGAPSANAIFNKNHCSAFVIIDCKVKVGRRRDGDKTLNIVVTKIHAVMQPSSIGEMGDFVDNMQAEVLERQEERSRELSDFKEKTKRFMQTFEVKTKDSNIDQRLSWLADYAVTFTIRNIGVAFPLAFDQTLEFPRATPDESAAVRAFLFSVRSLTFDTERTGAGSAMMQSFSFQFVNHFRQSVPADFSGESHVSYNRLIYPEMNAQLRSEKSSDSRRIRIGANVSGFILDLDPSIPDYVFSLVDVYRQGKHRVDQLTANTPRNNIHTAPPRSSTLDESQLKSILTSNVILSLVFYSGQVRFQTEFSSSVSRTKTWHTSSSARPSSSSKEIFSLPMVTVWGEYRAAPLYRKLSGPRLAEPSTLTFKSTVHSSENTLRPTLLPFVSELVRRIEHRMRKASRRHPATSAISYPDAVPAVLGPSQSSVSADTRVSSSLQITFALRIDQSKLRLTCQPDVNVLAGIHWNSGGFIVNISPGAREISFMGNVSGLTVGLKHGFLSEDCIRLDARDLAFSVTFAKVNTDTGKTIGSVSVILDTEVSGGVRFSRFQDLLCFKAVWLDRIPVFTSGNLSLPLDKVTGASANVTVTKQDLTTILLVHVRHIALDADLGQSISAVKLDMQDISLRSKLGEYKSEVSLSITDLRATASGNVSGIAHIPKFVFRTIRRRDMTSASIPAEHGPRMLDLSLTSGTISISLESDYQQILQVCADPLEIVVFDDWSKISPDIAINDRRLRLSFAVSGTEITIITTVGALPKLVSYASKFKSSLASQREGASRESQAFRATQSPKPDNPLSAVANAMIRSARTRLKEAEASLSYIIQQEMKVFLRNLRLVVFPRTMVDVELAHFVARDVRARLTRTVRSETSPTERELYLAFSSMTTSKFSQLNHPSGSQDASNDGKSWLAVLLKNASEATIFDLPSMTMSMTSEEVDMGSRKVVTYSFVSKFVRGEGIKDLEDIYITLNVSLYSWLTILRKNLARELEQVQSAADWRPSIIPPGTASPTSPYNKTTDSSSEIPGDGKLSRKIPILTSSAASHMRPSPLTSYSGAPGRGDADVPTVVNTRPGDSIEEVAGSANVATQMVSVPSTSLNVDPHSKASGIVYVAQDRRIERLNMRQLGEATPDVMHPFFMKKAGFSLEDSLPQYVHEYATMPIDEITRLLLSLYSKQLNDTVH